MKILVAYASQHGATQGIAERIAARLNEAGLEADLRPVHDAGEPGGYDAVVAGSAAYLGHWQKEAAEWVRRHREALATRPVWLFSSGPLGTEPTDAEGHDLREASEPKEFAEFEPAIRPRGHHVFFGALDPATLGFRDRLIRAMPAGRALLPEGDFRDWQDIDQWATDIAAELGPAGRG